MTPGRQAFRLLAGLSASCQRGSRRLNSPGSGLARVHRRSEHQPGHQHCRRQGGDEPPPPPAVPRMGRSHGLLSGHCRSPCWRPIGADGEPRLPRSPPPLKRCLQRLAMCRTPFGASTVRGQSRSGRDRWEHPGPRFSRLSGWSRGRAPSSALPLLSRSFLRGFWPRSSVPGRSMRGRTGTCRGRSNCGRRGFTGPGNSRSGTARGCPQARGGCGFRDCRFRAGGNVPWRFSAGRPGGRGLRVRRRQAAGWTFVELGLGGRSGSGAAANPRGSRPRRAGGGCRRVAAPATYLGGGAALWHPGPIGGPERRFKLSTSAGSVNELCWPGSSSTPAGSSRPMPFSMPYGASRPPATGLKTLQKYVAELRKALGAGVAAHRRPRLLDRGQRRRVRCGALRAPGSGGR